MITCKTKRLNNKAVLPTFGSADAACADLYACTDHDFISIAPHSTVKIGTGLAMEIPCGYQGKILARSGVSSNRYLRPANCVGTIDSDYRGEIIVALHNDSDMNQYIENGERIAQIEIVKKLDFGFVEADELSKTERGDGGFGSSGTKEVKKKKQYKEIELDDEFWSM